LQRRIGVYGGTFDPIHHGHLNVATTVLAVFALDQVLFVPAFVPPHKRTRAISSPYHRYAMVALATQDSAALAVSTIELEAPTRPYTIDTLRRLQIEQAAAQLFFLMGADSFEEINTWREHERLLGEYNIIVATRPGYRSDAALAAHLAPQLQAQVVDLRGGRRPDLQRVVAPRIYLTDYVQVEVSATEVREAVAAGRAIDHLVPKAVAGYIAKCGLYRKEE
jgi:nicotinate-nucleotide adenylyltransferase